MTPTFVLATANPDKAAEVEAILLDAFGHRIRLLPRPADIAEVEETGATLTANARLKAAAVAAATGSAAIADDTGLEVDALGGAPGVHSARYAGEKATYADNVAKLLHELDGVATSRRTARFTTVIVARLPDGTEVLATGQVEGLIATQTAGDGGFGYDCVFLPDGGGGRTFAQMSSREKHALSHRGRAIRTLAQKLGAFLTEP